MDGQVREMDEQIRRVLAEYGRIRADMATLDGSADLYRAGMTSHASVSVMLALEDAFDIEFPETMLRKSTFESVSAISAALTSLVGAPAELPISTAVAAPPAPPYPEQPLGPGAPPVPPSYWDSGLIPPAASSTSVGDDASLPLVHPVWSGSSAPDPTPMVR